MGYAPAHLPPEEAQRLRLPGGGQPVGEVGQQRQADQERNQCQLQAPASEQVQRHRKDHDRADQADQGIAGVVGEGHAAVGDGDGNQPAEEDGQAGPQAFTSPSLLHLSAPGAPGQLFHGQVPQQGRGGQDAQAGHSQAVEHV